MKETGGRKSRHEYNYHSPLVLDLLDIPVVYNWVVFEQTRLFDIPTLSRYSSLSIVKMQSLWSYSAGVHKVETESKSRCGRSGVP